MRLRCSLAALAAVLGITAMVLLRGHDWAAAGPLIAPLIAELTAALLLAAALLTLRPRASTLLLATVAAWLMAEWSNPEAPGALVFTAGLLAAGLAPALATHALLEPGRRPDAVVIASAYLSAVLLGPAIALLADPRVQGCGSCPADLVAIADAPGLALLLQRLGLVLGAAAAAAAITLALSRLVHRSAAGRRATAPLVVPTASFLAVAAAAHLHELQRGGAAFGSVDRALLLAEAGALLALAAGVGWQRLAARRIRARLADVVVEMGEAARPGDLGSLLTEVLRDPTFELLYAHDGDWIDARGRPYSPVPGAGRERTVLLEDGEVVATALHQRELLDDERLLAEFQRAARLGLDHERLQAQLRAEVERLRSARTAIVDAADHHRRRLERDLHDSAQQGLAALAMAIGLEHSHADGPTATCLGLAQARAQEALDRVRAIAHHLYPAALGDAGLAAALDVLSEWRPHVELHELPNGRFPAPVETGGYFLVAALTQSPARAVVSASDAPGRLVVEVRTARPGDLVEAEDRVGALGGRLTVEPGADGAIQLRAELPCES